jgi:hypothetical protein
MIGEIKEFKIEDEDKGQDSDDAEDGVEINE